MTCNFKHNLTMHPKADGYLLEISFYRNAIHINL